jgi:DNA polymerase zeta
MAADSIPSWTRPSTPSIGCQVSSAFSCRIVDIGSYFVSPHSDLDVIYSNYSGERIKSVPIIRIFGATPGGQKACVHVHGAFPYLYIPYGIDNPTYNYLQILHQSIDHALQIINNKHDDTSYVFKILPVRGIPFYGYHGDKQVFLKILLYAPENVKKLSDLLLSGAIMNETYQPHESHIPFPLQFMIDYNLYGMNFIHASSVKFRVKDLITDG